MALERYINTLELTSGERLTIARRLYDLATRRGLTDLASRAHQAMEHERLTCEHDNRWARRDNRRMYAQEVAEIDDKVDPVLTSIRDIALGHTRGLPMGDPLGPRVETMLDDVFPVGVGAVVSMAFVDQAAATEVIVGKLMSTHAGLIRELGLEGRVRYLAELAEQYSEAVDQNEGLSYAEVQALRKRGQELLRELIAMILGRFADSSDPANVTARDQLLQPVDQETRNARLRRARRRSTGSADAPLDVPEDAAENAEEDAMNDAPETPLGAEPRADAEG